MAARRFFPSRGGCLLCRGGLPAECPDRIGARVPREVYETLCRAAELTGATVNQFLVQAALKEAREVIERQEVIRLSPRDWNWLLDLMENPPKPNAKLKAALKRYRKAQRPQSPGRRAANGRVVRPHQPEPPP